MRPAPVRLLAPWRRAVQLFLALCFVAPPLVRLNGEPLARFDLAAQTLRIAGLRLGVHDFFLLWLALFVVAFAFLLVTMTLGRVWCGWLCPQTALMDLVEGVAGPGGRLLARGAVAAILATAVAFVTVAWFVDSGELAHALGTSSLTGWPLVGFSGVALVVFVDLLLVGRGFCRNYCPYGRIQTAVAEAGTLTLHLPPDQIPACIHCRACVRACPMGIDIRDGIQAACINCGRCLDACRTVMARRGHPGLIRYTFGTGGQGVRSLVSPRLLLVTVALLAAVAGFWYAALARPEAGLVARRLGGVEARRLATGEVAVFCRVTLDNRGQAAADYEIRVLEPAGVTVAGESRAPAVAVGEHRNLNLVLRLSPELLPVRVRLGLFRPGNPAPLATTAILLPETTSP